MFKFDEADYPISLQEIQSKLSELEIFKIYCPNFKELGRDFLSEFYNDTRPSCRVYRRANGVLAYKDFGTGENYNCYRYIMRKYYCTFPECLNIIANDFNLNSLNFTIRPNIILSNDEVDEDNDVYYKPEIEIVSQPYNIVDATYWKLRKISLSYIEEYGVKSCSHVYLHKKDKTIVFEYKKDNPIYAIEQYDEEGKFVGYKIYKPLEPDKRYKWLTTVGSDIIQGYHKLPKTGDILILTKSIKDVISYKLLDIPAIALQSESIMLGIEIRDKLLRRFKQIIVNFDGDTQGHSQSALICQANAFKGYFLDDYKDLSDYLVENSIKDAKKMINGKIREIKEKG